MLGLYAGRWPKTLHYRSIPCLNTLVGSVCYLITMLKNSLLHYIVELYPNFYIADLYPILTQCWGIPYLIIMLSNFQRLKFCWAITNPNTLLILLQLCIIHCWTFPNFNTYWAIPNPNTLSRYTLSYYMAISQILIHCWTIAISIHTDLI